MFGWFIKETNNFVRIPVEKKGDLFASPMPAGPYDGWNDVLKSYKKNKVKHVVTLNTNDEIKNKCKKDLFALLKKNKINSIHFPIPDLTCPTHEEVTKLIDKIIVLLEDGERVAVHCTAGVGRTGVIVACVVHRALGLSGVKSLEYIHEYLKINITAEQKNFIINWEQDVVSSEDE